MSDQGAVTRSPADWWDPGTTTEGGVEMAAPTLKLPTALPPLSRNSPAGERTCSMRTPMVEEYRAREETAGRQSESPRRRGKN
jgi:hypothetical protein